MNLRPYDGSTEHRTHDAKRQSQDEPTKMRCHLAGDVQDVALGTGSARSQASINAPRRKTGRDGNSLTIAVQ